MVAEDTFAADLSRSHYYFIFRSQFLTVHFAFLQLALLVRSVLGGKVYISSLYRQVNISDNAVEFRLIIVLCGFRTGFIVFSIRPEKSAIFFQVSSFVARVAAKHMPKKHIRKKFKLMPNKQNKQWKKADMCYEDSTLTHTSYRRGRLHQAYTYSIYIFIQKNRSY